VIKARSLNSDMVGLEEHSVEDLGEPTSELLNSLYQAFMSTERVDHLPQRNGMDCA
jgi:hypothetical protein